MSWVTRAAHKQRRAATVRPSALGDAFVDSWVSWREASEDVRTAYRWWNDSAGRHRGVPFEGIASPSIARSTQRASTRIGRSASGRTPPDTATWPRGLRDCEASALAERDVAAGPHQPRLVGEHHKLCPVAGVELDHRTADVGLGRRWADDEALGDLVVSEPVSDECDHLALSCGQLIEKARARRHG